MIQNDVIFSNPIFWPSKCAFPSHKALPHCLEYTVIIRDQEWKFTIYSRLARMNAHYFQHLPQLSKVCCWVTSIVDFEHPTSHSEWPQIEQEWKSWPCSDSWHIPSTIWNRFENGSFNAIDTAGVNLNGIGLDERRLARERSLCSLVCTQLKALDIGIKNPGISGCRSLIELISLMTWGQPRLLNRHVAHSIPFSPCCTTPYPPSSLTQTAPSFPTLTRSRESFIID